MKSNFRFECRVYFEDTDAGGVVYNANYLKFYERARTEYLRSLGFEQDELLRRNVVFVVRNINIDFIRAVRFNERLVLESSISELKKASLVFQQETYIYPLSQKSPVNTAMIKVVCVTADTFRPIAIPQDIVEKLIHE